MPEEVGHGGISPWTDKALDLHDYQYNGPDPDLVLSKYRNRDEAAVGIKLLIDELIRRIEGLRPRVRWGGDELEGALRALREGLGKARWSYLRYATCRN